MKRKKNYSQSSQSENKAAASETKQRIIRSPWQVVSMDWCGIHWPFKKKDGRFHNCDKAMGHKGKCKCHCGEVRKHGVDIDLYFGRSAAASSKAKPDKKKDVVPTKPKPKPKRLPILF